MGKTLGAELLCTRFVHDFSKNFVFRIKTAKSKNSHNTLTEKDSEFFQKNKKAHKTKKINPVTPTTSRRAFLVHRIFVPKMRLHFIGCRSSFRKSKGTAFAFSEFLRFSGGYLFRKKISHTRRHSPFFDQSKLWPISASTAQISIYGLVVSHFSEPFWFAAFLYPKCGFTLLDGVVVYVVTYQLRGFKVVDLQKYVCLKVIELYSPVKQRTKAAENVFLCSD